MMILASDPPIEFMRDALSSALMPRWPVRFLRICKSLHSNKWLDVVPPDGVISEGCYERRVVGAILVGDPAGQRTGRCRITVFVLRSWTCWFT